MLELLDSDEFDKSNVGSYLQSLRSHFRGEVVADMLCYLRLHLELEMMAKGMLLMRQEGLSPELEPGTRAKFDELRYLERSIGRGTCLRGRLVAGARGADLLDQALPHDHDPSFRKGRAARPRMSFREVTPHRT